MNIDKIYSIPLWEEISVIVGCGKEIYALKEGEIQHLKELPPAACEYSNWAGIFKLFHKKQKNDFPTNAHKGILLGGYYSKVDSIYFFENGATIYIIHKNLGLRKNIYFFTEEHSRRIGLVLHAIKSNHMYKEIGISSFENYPFNRSYIVFPGFVEQKHIMQRYPILTNEQTRSIDFVQGYLHPDKNPNEVEPFINIPKYICELINVNFNFSRWYSFFNKDDTSHSYSNCVHPFFKEGKCIAEIIIINNCELDVFEYFPYFDSYVLTIRYNPEWQLYISNIIRIITSRHPNIVTLPYHLCEASYHNDF